MDQLQLSVLLFIAPVSRRNSNWTFDLHRCFAISVSEFKRTVVHAAIVLFLFLFLELELELELDLDLDLDLQLNILPDWYCCSKLSSNHEQPSSIATKILPVASLTV